jgi:uncharacterized protein YbaR (Trm112 family)
MKVRVRIGKDQTVVVCPFCKQEIDLEDVAATSCGHLDSDDYITPRGPYEEGYDVWFTDSLPSLYGREGEMWCLVCGYHLTEEEAIEAEKVLDSGEIPRCPRCGK